MSTKKSNGSELSSASLTPIQMKLDQPIEPIVARSSASGSTSTIDPTLLNAALPAVNVGARTSELDSLRDSSVGSSADDQGKSDGAPAGLSANDALRNVSVIDSADDGATPSPFEELAASTAFPSHQGIVQDDGGMMSAGKEGRQGSSGGQSGVTESAGGQQSGLSPDDRPDNPLDGMFAADGANTGKEVNLSGMLSPVLVGYEEGTGVIDLDPKEKSGGSDTPTYVPGSPSADVLQAALDEQDGVSRSSKTEVTVLGDETITKTTSADGQITKWTFSADGSVVIVDRNNGTTTEMNADGSTRTTWEGKTLNTTPPLTGDKLEEDFEIPEEMAWLLENDLARLRAQQPDHSGDDVDPVDTSTGALAGVDNAAGSLDDPKNRYLGGDTHDPDGPVYTGGGSDPEAGGDVDPNPDESGPPQTSGPEEDIPSHGSQPERPNQTASAAEGDDVGQPLDAMNSFELPTDALALLLAADEFAASHAEEEFEDSLADSIVESVAKLDFDVAPDLGQGWPQLGTDVAELNTGDFGV